MKRAISILLSIAIIFAMCPAITTFAGGASTKVDLSSYINDMTSASNFAQTVVTASASYERYGIGVAALIDGDTSTRFAGISEEDKAAGAAFKETWIQLDLQKVYTVDKLSFTAYATASSAGLPKDFTIEVSKDGTQWTTVYTKTGLAAVAGTNQFSFEFEATDARYVKLNVTAIGRACDLGNCVCLKELDVYGVEKAAHSKENLSGGTIADIDDVVFTGEAVYPEPVVTLGGTTLQKDIDYTLSYENNDKVGTAKVIVTGKGNYEGTLEAEFTIVENTPIPESAKIDLTGYVSGMTSASNFAQTVVTASASYEKYGIGVAALIDGDTSTRFAGISEEDKAAGAAFKETWIQLDLQKVYTVDKLSFTANATASSAGLPKDFTIEVSEDGTQWTTVYTKTGLAAVAGTNQFSFDFAATDARYVKLNVTAIGRACDVGECVCLKELEVYGVEKEGAEVPSVNYIAAESAVFTYYGRWQKKENGMRSGWGTSKMRFHFTGSKFDVLVEDAVEGATILAKIDSANPVSVTVTDGVASFTCTAGEHEVLIMTGNSASKKSNLTITGIEFEAGSQVKKTTSTRKTVEIIGDSISDGWFGNVTSSYITDLRMGWEAINVACAGITLTDGIFNWASRNDKVGLESLYFKATNNFDETEEWVFTEENEPDYIYINIGTNDYGQGVSEADFKQTYEEFLTNIRAKNPNAMIFCVSPYGGFYGEEGAEEFVHAMEKPIYEAVKARQNAGDTNVYYIDTLGLLTAENADEKLSDNLHPAPGTYSYFADWIVPRLEHVVNGHADQWENGVCATNGCEITHYHADNWVNNTCSVCGAERVDKVNLSNAAIADIDDVIFTGTAVCPEPAVTLGGVILQKGVDYTLRYENNDRIGTGKVIVSGMGNYEGTLEAEFTIINDPSAPVSSKIDLSGYVSGMTSASNFAQTVVTASASYEKYGIGVAALIDGDTSTRFAGIAAKDLEAAFVETWIQLDLQKVYTVDKLAFTAYVTASSQGLPKDFTIEVSENGTTWTTVYTKTGLAAVAGTNQFSFEFTAVDARYVKLNVTAIGRACDLGNCVCLKELEVYGIANTQAQLGEKLEINTDKVTASGEYTPDMGKNNLFDGDLDTIFAAIDPDEAPGIRMDEWFQIDLQKSYTINRIRLANRSDAIPLSGLPSVFDVMVSNDGENWQVVKSVDGISASDITEKHWLTVDFAPVDARYVRVRAYDVAVIGEATLGYAVTLREFEVHTAEGKIDLSSFVPDLDSWSGHPGSTSQYTYYASNYPQNVVTSSQSYEKWGWGIAGLIDGIVGKEAIFSCRTSASVGPIQAMKNEILVDLNAAYFLNGMRFASMKPNSMEGLPADFKVEVSLDGITWTTVLNKTGITTEEADADGQFYTFVVDQIKPIRFVRFIVTKVNQPASEALGYCAALSELELYGTLDPNTQIKPDGYGKVDLSKSVIRATNSYNKWSHGTGNLYNGDQSANMFIAISEEDADYYKVFMDEKVFENTSNEFIKIRLDGIYAIDIMRFQSQWANSGKGVPNSYTLECSLDGETWTTALVVDGKAVSADGWYIDEFAPVQARYLRLKFHNFIDVGDLGYAAHLKELEFYGTLIEKDLIDLDVPAPEPPALEPLPGDNPSAGNNPPTSDNPPTGDPVEILNVTVMLASFMILTVLFINRRRFVK